MVTGFIVLILYQVKRKHQIAISFFLQRTCQQWDSPYHEVCRDVSGMGLWQRKRGRTGLGK